MGHQVIRGTAIGRTGWEEEGSELNLPDLKTRSETSSSSTMTVTTAGDTKNWVIALASQLVRGRAGELGLEPHSLTLEPAVPTTTRSLKSNTLAWFSRSEHPTGSSAFKPFFCSACSWRQAGELSARSLLPTLPPNSVRNISQDAQGSVGHGLEPTVLGDGSLAFPYPSWGGQG